MKHDEKHKEGKQRVERAFLEYKNKILNEYKCKYEEFERKILD